MSCIDKETCNNKTIIDAWMLEALTDSNLTDDVVKELKSRAIRKISMAHAFQSYFFIKLEDNFESINIKCAIKWAIANDIKSIDMINYCDDLLTIDDKEPEDKTTIEPIETFDIINEKYEAINLDVDFITNWRIKPHNIDYFKKDTIIGIKTSLLFNYDNSCCIETNALLKCEDAFKKLIRYYISSTMTNNHDIQPTNYEFKEAEYALQNIKDITPMNVNIASTRRYW